MGKMIESGKTPFLIPYFSFLIRYLNLKRQNE